MYPYPYFPYFWHQSVYNMMPSWPPSIQKPPPEQLSQVKKEGRILSEKIILQREDLEQCTYQADKKLWSQGEDLNLLKLVDKEGLSFPQISRKIEGRTYSMCYSRYKRLKLHAKKTWSAKDDKKLIRLVQKTGHYWKIISSHFQGRTSQQIRERYLNILKPQITNQRWTLQEDLKFIQMINKYGKSWKNIEKEMPHRSQNQLKNRYFNRIRKLDQNKKSLMTQVLLQ